MTSQLLSLSSAAIEHGYSPREFYRLLVTRGVELHVFRSSWRRRLFVRRTDLVRVPSRRKGGAR